MGLTATLVAIAAGLALAVTCNLIDRRPSEPGKPRLIPYLGIQYLALLLVVLMLGHLVSLLTGKPFTGRMGF